MSNLIYVVATEWGGDKGGINIFNRSLTESLSKNTSSNVEVVSINQTPAPGGMQPTDRLRFLTFEENAEALAKTIRSDVEGSEVERIVVVGHDVHTGPKVVEACKQLNLGGTQNFESAIFCHMDYEAYQHLKTSDRKNVQHKSEQQWALILEADFIFAVGPLLAENFSSLAKSRGTSIVPVIPGFPEQLLAMDSPTNHSPPLKFFFSGRIDQENDPIKNGQLALRAIDSSYQRMGSSPPPLWRNKGKFIAFGFSDIETDIKWFESAVDKPDFDRWARLDAREFADQATMFRELRNCHVALMPSAHEGFGLAGWEAICAGIPLICSHQSGLAQFLEKLFSDQHDLGSDSILIPRLAENEGDVEILTSSILELTRTYERRKVHAKRLALHLQKNFSWESTARSVSDALGFSSRSTLYRTNEQKASRARLKPQFDKARQLASEGRSLVEWQTTFDGLDYLSDANEDYGELGQDAKHLGEIRDSIAAEYAESQEAEPEMRKSGRLDIAWRYMAAASSVAETLKEFCESIPSLMSDEIFADSFLSRELLYYCNKFRDQFGDSSEQYARSFFARYFKSTNTDAALQRRFARICTAFPEFVGVTPEEARSGSVFQDELDRCDSVKSGNFDLNDLLRDSRSLGPTALALAALDKKMDGKGVDQIFDALTERSEGMDTLRRKWRGDKLLDAALLAAVVHPNELLEFIEALARDEEEALRWAAIELAFSPALRTRLFQSSRSGMLELSPGQLKAQLGNIVDLAVECGGSHPWTQREFLKHYKEEQCDKRFPQTEDRFTLSDFPFARKLLGPPPNGSASWQFERLHPEVEDERKDLRQTIKRVMLVLPPISPESQNTSVSNTSTPPLGLGLVGSRLLEEGHDVYLADCHRAPESQAEVINIASKFDWIGFNVVLPTAQSFFRMASSIKKNANAPRIVVGGPAVNLGSFRNTAVDPEQRTVWDFAIFDDAEENFVRLVGETRQMRNQLPDGILPNRDSELVQAHRYPVVRQNTLNRYPTKEWSISSHLDRRIFSASGSAYEPQKTRAVESTAVEAHVVMSKGCDWNCSFCTERQQSSGGERRRLIDSVEAEIRELTRRHDDLRIQFIDDNLLPQIATIASNDHTKTGLAKDWAQSFIRLLEDIKQQKGERFGWRGIFRLEDFFQYEEMINDFAVRLHQSGCSMLAFGIEHGNERKRVKMKGGRAATDKQIVELFAKLSDLGIFTKGYFILGGPNETAESSGETIDFALSCGVSLAYFALYKSFTKAVKTLRNDQPSDSQEHKKFASYQQLDINWDQILSTGIEDPTNAKFKEFSGRIAYRTYSLGEQSILQSYSDLKELGFRFSDIVKYSDHHADDEISLDALNNVNFNDQSLFEDTVLSAYANFYMRENFVDTYRALLASGY